VNPFAHVNHSSQETRLGVLLCINGTGSMNSWIRKNVAEGLSYSDINDLAGDVPIGSDGLIVLPFGNGAERMLENKNLGCRILDLDFNRHTRSHLFRASQEGVAFSFRYGIDIMKEMGLKIKVIRAANANMFLSPIFRKTLANVTDTTIELYETDGAQGAARGAALSAGIYSSPTEAFQSLKKIDTIQPNSDASQETQRVYQRWISRLVDFM
jgi:xylulokinase